MFSSSKFTRETGSDPVLSPNALTKVLRLWFARSLRKTAGEIAIAGPSELSILGQEASERSPCTWLKTQGRA